MKPAVIFDVDGTLVSLVFDAKKTRLELIEVLASMGFDTAGLSDTTTTRTIMEAARTQSGSGSVPHDYLSVRKLLYDILDESEVRTAPLAKTLPGARDTLELLKRNSVRLAALTNSGRRAALDVLGRADMSHFFEFILTRDDVEALKPDPRGLIKALSLLSLARGDVVYVGDSLMDIATAKGAGVGVIAVSTGIYSEERLRQDGPDHVIGSLSDVPAILGITDGHEESIKAPGPR